MATEMLSYGQLAERLSCSAEAARALVKRLRLPRQKANDGKVLVSVDLSEINHKPMPARSPAAHHPITASLKSQVEALKAALIKLEATATGHILDIVPRLRSIATPTVEAYTVVRGAAELLIS
jgi:hypothetical protein